MSNRIFSNQRGQTLVDLVVALALLSSSVASAGILSTASSRSSDEAGRRSQATALADRELEGLRSIRDVAEHGADDTIGWTATPPFDVSSCHQVTLKQVVTVSGTGWTIADHTAVANTPEAYAQFDFVPALTTPSSYKTAFKRLVRLCPTNEYKQADSTRTVQQTTPSIAHAFTVAITVSWDEANGTRQVVLNSLLSDYVQ